MSWMISLIMPVLNGERYLPLAIEAVTSQADGTRCELIVVGNKSTDATNQIVDAAVDRHPGTVHWLNVADDGLSNAINLGIRAARGELISYLGADDILLPGVLAVVERMARATGCDALYCDSYAYEPATARLRHRRCPNLAFTKQNLLRFGTIVGLQNMFFHREVFSGAEFSEGNRYGQDYEFYLEHADKLNAVHLPVVSSLNILDGNISTSLADVQRQEAIAVALRHCSSMDDLLSVVRGQLAAVSTPRQRLRLWRCAMKQAGGPSERSRLLLTIAVSEGRLRVGRSLRRYGLRKPDE